MKIYSIVDKDAGPSIVAGGELGRSYSWDVYHIENYLLDSKFIFEALKHIGVYRDDLSSADEVEQTLRGIARDQIDQLVGHQLRAKANGELVSDLNLGLDIASEDVWRRTSPVRC